MNSTGSRPFSRTASSINLGCRRWKDVIAGIDIGINIDVGVGVGVGDGNVVVRICEDARSDENVEFDANIIAS